MTDVLYRKQGKRYVPVPDKLDTWSGFMVLCAVRYCLGRASYAPGVAMEWCRAHWGRLSPKDHLIVRDVIEWLADRQLWDDGKGMTMEDYRTEWTRFALDRIMNEQTPPWYMVDKDGMATLCADQADAEREAEDAQAAWPEFRPHRAVQLVDASQAFTAADMATAEARGFRDGQAAELAAMRAGGVPVGWMWQHEENGRTGFVDCWQVENGWQENNPRLRLVSKLYTHPQPAAQAGEDGTFLILPPRPKAEAPANTVGLDWDAYSGMQVLAYGRACADAAIAAQQGDSHE